MIPDYNFYLFPFIPFIPANCDKPPTLYSVLNSIVNGLKDEDDYTKIKNLAKEGRSVIFDFDYPLTSNIEKEKFETMILNHFLMRRIGFETVTAFKIQLDVKLNEIMPLYNKMFDAIKNWDIFNDGEVLERTGNDNKNSESTSTTTNEIKNTSETESTLISDKRNPELPQNELDDVKDGKYVTNYNYDTDTNNSKDNSTSNGNSSSTNNSNDVNTYTETIKKSPNDKISILKEMQENINSIYAMIFKDLECLFYQIA